MFRPHRYRDERGWLSEVMSGAVMGELGREYRPIQENQSWSPRAGTVRGRHFQRAPHGQAKMVRVAHGAVMSGLVDLRRGSPTFEQAMTVRQDAADGLCLFVPRGCAHGVVTLTGDTMLLWSCDAPFRPEACDGVRWDDPALGLDWGIDPAGAIISPKDRALPLLAEQTHRFEAAAAGPG